MVKKKTGAAGKVLPFNTEYDIAYDFSVKSYEKFGKLIKSMILFGSTAKKNSCQGKRY